MTRLQHAPWPMGSTPQGELLINGVPLSDVAERVGQTPFYAYDRSVIARQIRRVRSALPAGVAVHYAMKANPLPDLVRFMLQGPSIDEAAGVDGIDVASGGELQVALAAGAPPSEISFAGPGKRATELQQAVAAGVLVNVESRRELPLLAQAQDACAKPARVALRLNPDFELKGSGMRMGGGPKPFGIDAEQAPQVLAEVAALGLAFEGFHIYAGSQNLNAASICQAQQCSLELAIRLAQDAPSPVRTLNLGGGFGVPYFPGEMPLDLKPIGENLNALQQRAAAELPGVRLVIELGRYLVAPAGVYVARVLDRKISRGQVFLVVDGGLHHHLAASGNFGQVLRRNYPVALGHRLAPSDGEEGCCEVVSVVGPLCTPLDLLADRVELPPAREGDLIVVFQSGAYGATASPQAFLGHPPVREILV